MLSLKESLLTNVNAQVSDQSNIPENLRIIEWINAHVRHDDHEKYWKTYYEYALEDEKTHASFRTFVIRKGALQISSNLNIHIKLAANEEIPEWVQCGKNISFDIETESTVFNLDTLLSCNCKYLTIHGKRLKTVNINADLRGIENFKVMDAENVNWRRRTYISYIELDMPCTFNFPYVSCDKMWFYNYEDEISFKKCTFPDKIQCFLLDYKDGKHKEYYGEDRKKILNS